MNASPLQRLVRHSYSDGSFSYHYAPVETNQDEALMNMHDGASSGDPADRYTYWPPQPMTPWLKSQPAI